MLHLLVQVRIVEHFAPEIDPGFVVVCDCPHSTASHSLNYLKVVDAAIYTGGQAFKKAQIIGDVFAASVILRCDIRKQIPDRVGVSVVRQQVSKRSALLQRVDE